MNFRGQIPEEVFINPSADKLITVFDEANEFKQLAIAKALRFYRSPINTNTKFLRRQLEEDYGFPKLPSDMPMDVLQALKLNAQDINALRGSKIGFELWLWCLTFGAITIVDGGFYPQPEFIQLSDNNAGYVNKVDPITPNVPNAFADPDLYLFDNATMFGVTQLAVTIVTKYDANQAVLDYINANYLKYLTFVTAGANITFTFSNGVYVTHAHPYQYFVLP